MSQRCTFVRRDGSQCGAWAISGSDKCIFHVEKIVKKAIAERSISDTEKIIILSTEIRAVQRRIKDPEKRSSEVRNLMSLLMQLEGKKKLIDNGPEEETLEKYIKRTYGKKS
jgi:hypothetical protein